MFFSGNYSQTRSLWIFFLERTLWAQYMIGNGRFSYEPQSLDTQLRIMNPDRKAKVKNSQADKICAKNFCHSMPNTVHQSQDNQEASHFCRNLSFGTIFLSSAKYGTFQQHLLIKFLCCTVFNTASSAVPSLRFHFVG